MAEEAKVCSVCERVVPFLYQEKHHLTPRCKKGKEKVLVCVDCGDQMHLIFNEKELRDFYNNMVDLKNDERVQKWIKWIHKKKYFGVCMKRKKKR